MSVGTQIVSSQMDQTLTALAVRLREVMHDIDDVYTQVTNGVLGNGTVTLESYGYSNSDATTALALLTDLATIAQVYAGQLQAGGTGGTGATLVNYDNALSVLWAVQ
jgi:hypothetical protein